MRDCPGVRSRTETSPAAFSTGTRSRAFQEEELELFASDDLASSDGEPGIALIGDRRTTARPGVGEPRTEASCSSAPQPVVTNLRSVQTNTSPGRRQTSVSTMTDQEPEVGPAVRFNGRELFLPSGTHLMVEGRRFLVTAPLVAPALEDCMETRDSGTQMEDTLGGRFRDEWRLEHEVLGHSSEGTPLGRARVTHTFECPFHQLQAAGTNVKQYFVPADISGLGSDGGPIPPGAAPPYAPYGYPR